MEVKPNGLRKAKWNTLLTYLETDYLSCNDCEGIPVHDVGGKKRKKNTCAIRCVQKAKDNRFAPFNLSRILAAKETRNKFKRNHSYQEQGCSNSNSTINFSLQEPFNNTVPGHHTLRKNSLNNNICLGEGSAKSGNIGIKMEDMNMKNIRKNNEIVGMTKNKSTNTPKINTISNNLSCATKMTYSYESMLDVCTNSNMKLIQNIIDDIKKQQSKTQKDRLTLNKLVAINIENNISLIEKACISVYLRQKHIKYNVNEDMMLKLICLMISKEYREIYKCILGMEIYRCRNLTDDIKFNALIPRIKKAIFKFLQYNESSILEIYLDYMICTFDYRKKKDMF